MAVDFLPPHIRQLMNLLASLDPCRGSGFKVSALAVRLPMTVPSGSFSVRRRGGLADGRVGPDRPHGPVGLEKHLADLLTGRAGDADPHHPRPHAPAAAMHRQADGSPAAGAVEFE